eukprot:COSAG01_NODE_39968_length_469_cov_2.097297_1_plen_57_part_01
MTFPGQMMATYMLGMLDFYCSHEFAYMGAPGYPHGAGKRHIPHGSGGDAATGGGGHG